MVTVVGEASPNGLWLKYPPTVFDQGLLYNGIEGVARPAAQAVRPDQPRMPFEPMPERVEP